MNDRYEVLQFQKRQTETFRFTTPEQIGAYNMGMISSVVDGEEFTTGVTRSPFRISAIFTIGGCHMYLYDPASPLVPIYKAVGCFRHAARKAHTLVVIAAVMSREVTPTASVVGDGPTVNVYDTPSPQYDQWLYVVPDRGAEALVATERELCFITMRQLFEVLTYRSAELRPFTEPDSNDYMARPL